MPSLAPTTVYTTLFDGGVGVVGVSVFSHAAPRVITTAQLMHKRRRMRLIVADSRRAYGASLYWHCCRCRRFGTHRAVSVCARRGPRRSCDLANAARGRHSNYLSDL